jgi:hypothetical protein
MSLHPPAHNDKSLQLCVTIALNRRSGASCPTSDGAIVPGEAVFGPVRRAAPRLSDRLEVPQVPARATGTAPVAAIYKQRAGN